jgi:hypothetical protein
MQLEYVSAVTIHAGIAARRQPGNTTPDNYDRFFWHYSLS